MTDVEMDFLSILLNHPELLKITVVKKEFFSNKELGKIFEILQEVEKFDPRVFIEKGFDDMELLLMIYQNFIYENSYSNIFKNNETKIINHHKTVKLDALNLRLAKREISYDDYKKEFDKIDAIKPVGTKEHPNQNEILNIITKKENFIGLGKFKRLGKVLLLETDDMVTVAAPPGFGKSAFLMNIFNECLNDDNNYCQYYNLEINNKQVIKRLIAIESKEKIVDVCKYDETNKENIGNAVLRLSKKNYYLYNNSIFYEKLQAEIISHLHKDKQNIVFIDYLGLIGLENNSYNRTNYDRVTYIMKELRKLCKSYNVLIFLASQCDRASLRNERITLFSLKDSGEIENSSTHVCLLYENKEKKADFDFIKNVIIDVAKNRNNYTYKLDMQFVGNKQIFTEDHKSRDVRSQEK